MSDLGSPGASLDTTRIDHLLGDSSVADLELTVIGVGSGGASVLQPLAMCGVRKWNIFDPDRLESINLVKHPATRQWIGRPKVEAIKSWLLDRNPAVQVHAFAEDVRRSSEFEVAAKRSDLVICAVDDPAARSWLNAECVRLGRPCVTGSVVRTGLGGQIYLYVPGETGCFACMQQVADRNNANLDDVLDLTDEEQHHRYGLGDENFTTSGLSIDIALVASFHAHMAWSVLVGGKSPYVPRLNFNWFTVGIRPERGVFASHYETKRVLVKAQADCHLACGSSER